MYEDGHLRRNNNLLNLIAVNKSKDWAIINYKHSHQAARLGAYCAFFISAEEYKIGNNDAWKNTAFEYLETIEDPLKTAYKPIVKETFDENKYSHKEYLVEVTKQSKRKAKNHINKLIKASQLPKE